MIKAFGKKKDEERIGETPYTAPYLIYGFKIKTRERTGYHRISGYEIRKPSAEERRYQDKGDVIYEHRNDGDDLQGKSGYPVFLSRQQ